MISVLHDMAGNVAEWCLDEWDGTFYFRSPANNPIAGGRNIEQLIANYKDVKGRHVLRGGEVLHLKRQRLKLVIGINMSLKHYYTT